MRWLDTAQRVLDANGAKLPKKARAPLLIGEPDTFGIHLYWTVFCLYLAVIL